MSDKNNDYREEYITLEEYIPAEKFRLVGSEAKDIPGGFTEIKVKLDISEHFASTLNFKTSRSGQLYGWVRACDKLKIENTVNKIHKIELYDWKEKFFMLFIYTSGSKRGFYVKSEDVKYLLEHCMRPQKNYE